MFSRLPGLVPPAAGAPSCHRNNRVIERLTMVDHVVLLSLVKGDAERENGEKD
jgi:hypothetical protein